MSGARRGTTRALLGCALLQALFGSGGAGAQVPVGPSTRELVAVNTDVERYLRVLQDLGIVPAYPWSVREFGPREIAALLPADTTHPWSARVRRTIYGSSDLYVVAPEAQAIYNSHLPFGYNDGALWAGRGITGALQGGIAGHAGPLSFTLEPIVFWAQNQSFPLIANGQSGRLSFADATNPLVIDQPQRFGDGAYSRFDLGQSTVRLDLPGVAIGASTANQQWGPAIDNPIILGNNAAGFPNVFIGTSNPLDLYAFTLQARMEWGRLDQSGFAVLQHDSTRRFMSGIVATDLAARATEPGTGRRALLSLAVDGYRAHVARLHSATRGFPPVVAVEHRERDGSGAGQSTCVVLRPLHGAAQRIRGVRRIRT